MNDALLAAMLQHDIDTETLAAEKHRNGNAKVTLSSFRGPQHQELAEELSEEEEESFYGKEVRKRLNCTCKNDKLCVLKFVDNKEKVFPSRKKVSNPLI